MGVTILIPVMIVTVIVGMVVGMVSVILMPVPGAPGTPVRRIIAVIPGRMPYHIGGQKHKPDYGPCGNLHCGNMVHHNALTINYPRITIITRIGGFSINGLYDVILTV